MGYEFGRSISLRSSVLAESSLAVGGRMTVQEGWGGGKEGEARVTDILLLYGESCYYCVVFVSGGLTERGRSEENK